MDAIKIANFRKDHPGQNFPSVRALTREECEQTKRRLSEMLLGRYESSGLDIVSALRDRGLRIHHVDADSKEFDLKSVAKELSIEPQDLVLINWERFEQIDEMHFSELCAHFDDIWYPAADYIDVFDTSFQWTISIGYSGEVLVVNVQ